MKREIICGIYKITSPSGRIYIGQSSDFNRRLQEYLTISKSRNQILLHNSFKKYTIENHIFELIEECEYDELNCRERHWQDFYNVLNEGLNLKLTNCGDIKPILSEETKRKISSSLVGRFKGEKHPLYGTKLSEERIQKLRECNKGRTATKEAKQKMSNSRKGKALSKEHKDNIGKSRKGEKHPLYGKNRGRHHGAKTVLNTQNGIFYDCVKDASDAYNINYSTLRGWLRGDYVNKSDLIYC